MTQVARIGLLGGTFDPPHFGHLWLAETAWEQLRLDMVLFLPVGQPPHKRGEPITAVSHRLTMTRLAIADNAHFEADTTDIDRQPPHATYSLLPLMQHAYPDSQIWLLIGGDSLRDLPQWRKPERVVAQCRLAALPRPGAAVNWDALEEAVPNVKSAVDMLDGPTIDISSTEIRGWARAGHTVRYLLPATVADYIHEAGLYGDSFTY